MELLRLLRSRNRHEIFYCAVRHLIHLTTKSHVFMNRNNYRGGRHKKADPSTAFRCSVNFTASEQSQLLAMQQQSGI